MNPQMNKRSWGPMALVAVAALGTSMNGCAAATDDEPESEAVAEVGQACVAHQPRRDPPVLTPYTRFYVPANTPAATQAAVYEEAGRVEDAALMRAMAAQPQAVFLGFSTPEAVFDQVRAVMQEAWKKRQTPVFAMYYVPNLNCSPNGAATEEDYQAWVDAVAAAIGWQPAVVIVEPNGVTLLPSEAWCAVRGGGTAEDAQPEDFEGVHQRFREIRYAVQRLEQLPWVATYLDAGHPFWQPLNDYDAGYGEPPLQFGIVNRLILAGIEHADGFSMNIWNNRTTQDVITYGERIAKCLSLLEADPNYKVEIYKPNVVLDDNGQPTSPCPSVDVLDAMPLTPREARHLTHFVIDTAANGQGAWMLGDPTTFADDAAAFQEIYGYETTDPQDWCAAPNRGLGVRPTTRTNHPLVDAFLWIENPGTSRTQCTRNLVAPDPNWETGYDVVRGMVDPPGGAWFEQQALELARLAVPPLLP